MIQAPALSLPGITHGFFTRQGGVSSGIFSSLNCGLGSGDDRGSVRHNRAAVAARLGLVEPRLLTAYQVHSAEALVVAAAWPSEERPRVDALVTATKGLAVGVLTADCGPILFADPEAGVVAAAHAGWRGALGGITTATLARMETLGARRGRIVAVLGPTISRQAYEVGPEFRDRFTAVDPANARYFAPSGRPGHALFDLPHYLLDRLRREGVGQVLDLALCTFSDEERFFSYRRSTHRQERDYGRLMSAIALA